ncbi:unnamed protein product, partial [Meganyctiphanes norvegica]
MAMFLNPNTLSENVEILAGGPHKVPIKKLIYGPPYSLPRGPRSLLHFLFHQPWLVHQVPQLDLGLLNLPEAHPTSEIESEVSRRLLELLQDDSQPSFITCKVLALMAAIPNTQHQVQVIFEDVVSVGKRSSSGKVLSHVVHTATALSQVHPPDPKLQHQVITLALSKLNSTHYIIKVRCLESLGRLCPVDIGHVQTSIMTALVDHTTDQDNRVRTAAFNALVDVQEKNIKLSQEVYDSVCGALSDDYQCVREAALSLIKLVAECDPERMIPIPESDHHVRLIDHAFSQICNAVNDISVRVRTQAASALGSMNGVSEYFLQQTLDKKLMSNMRRKRSMHERSKAMVESGEWSSGKRWADDAPKETVKANAVNIISNGACGAFVHGLEDEFLEVRNASLDSICNLAMSNSQFSNMCLDFLGDMFNDEIEEVRLKAILVLQQIAENVSLRADQLGEVLHALKDSSLDIRESLHTFLGNTQLSTMACVKMCVTSLLDNLRRYSQDRRSIHRCLRNLGTNHPLLVQALVPELLLIHPYFDGVEPSVQDGEYICKLILVLNAAAYCSTILPLLEQHTLRHYAYLHDTLPHLVPVLKLLKKSILPMRFLRSLRLTVQKLGNFITKLKLAIYQNVCIKININMVFPQLVAFVQFSPECIFLDILLIIRIRESLVTMAIFTWLRPNHNSVQKPCHNASSRPKNQFFRILPIYQDLSAIGDTKKLFKRLKTLVLTHSIGDMVDTGVVQCLSYKLFHYIRGPQQNITDEKMAPSSFQVGVHQKINLLLNGRSMSVTIWLQLTLITHNIYFFTAVLSPKLPPSYTHPGPINKTKQSSLAIHTEAPTIVFGGPSVRRSEARVSGLSGLKVGITYGDHTSLDHRYCPSKRRIKLNTNSAHLIPPNPIQQGASAQSNPSKNLSASNLTKSKEAQTQKSSKRRTFSITKFNNDANKSHKRKHAGSGIAIKKGI